MIWSSIRLMCRTGRVIYCILIPLRGGLLLLDSKKRIFFTTSPCRRSVRFGMEYCSAIRSKPDAYGENNLLISTNVEPLVPSMSQELSGILSPWCASLVTMLYANVRILMKNLIPTIGAAWQTVPRSHTRLLTPYMKMRPNVYAHDLTNGSTIRESAGLTAQVWI